MHRILQLRHSIFLLIVLQLISGCEEEQIPVRINYNQPDQEFKSSRIIITEKGITTAIVWAHRASVFEDRNYTVIEDSIAIEFFNKEGKRVSTLTAMSGEVWGLFRKVDSLKAAGNVVIVSEQRNAKMETPGILWLASIHKVFGARQAREKFHLTKKHKL